MRKTGQVVVITGAGGGLGNVFAVGLTEDGKLIAVPDYDTEAAQKVTAKVREQGGTAAATHCNVVDKNSVEQVHRGVREKLRKCNVLTNCAGVQDFLTKTTVKVYRQGEEMDTQVSKTNPDSLDSRGAARELLGKSHTLFSIDTEKMVGAMNVNRLGAVIASQVFAVDLVRMEGNPITNVTSVTAYDALNVVSTYAFSKAAVNMFTRWLSNYLSDEFGKVRASAVAPRYFLTPLSHDMYANPDGTYIQHYYDVIHRMSMGRLGDSRELVGALWFFADPDISGRITGQVIAVDGGFLSCPGT